MNKTKLIRRLIAKCRQLDGIAIDACCKLAAAERARDRAQAAAEAEAGNAAYYAERNEANARRARRAEQEAQQERDNASSRDWERSQIMDRLNRARSWGDKSGEERALRDLRNL